VQPLHGLSKPLTRNTLQGSRSITALSCQETLERTKEESGKSRYYQPQLHNRNMCGVHDIPTASISSRKSICISIHLYSESVQLRTLPIKCISLSTYLALTNLLLPSTLDLIPLHLPSLLIYFPYLHLPKTPSVSLSACQPIPAHPPPCLSLPSSLKNIYSRTPRKSRTAVLDVFSVL
jgi:hypothetical protein